MESLSIYGQPLQQERRTPADGIAAVLGKLFKKLLMTEERARGLPGFE